MSRLAIVRLRRARRVQAEVPVQPLRLDLTLPVGRAGSKAKRLRFTKSASTRSDPARSPDRAISRRHATVPNRMSAVGTLRALRKTILQIASRTRGIRPIPAPLAEE